MDIDRDRGIMKTTLVIMAAGICSRFGGGIKQLAPVGLNGEIIMDYIEETGVVVENPVIGHIPFRQEIVNELEELLMTM